MNCIEREILELNPSYLCNVYSELGVACTNELVPINKVIQKIKNTNDDIYKLALTSALYDIAKTRVNASIKSVTINYFKYYAQAIYHKVYTKEELDQLFLSFQRIYKS